MKKLLPVFFFFLASISFAQTIDVVVFSERGEEFILFVNSIQQNEVPRANVKAKDLKGDSFVLRIEFLNTQIPALTKNIYSENKDIELTAVVKQNKKGKYVLRYMGETPKNPETDIYAEESYVVYESPDEDINETNESNVITTSETVTTTTTVTTDYVDVEPHDMNEEVSLNMSVSENGMSVNAGDGEESVNMNISVSENGMDVATGTGEENINMNISINATGTDSYVESSETVTTTTTTYTSTSNVTSNEEVYGEGIETEYEPVNTRCSYSMSSAEFADASESVKSKTFEDDKLTVAKQICRTNCMTSEQIRDINKLFDFEDTKLEFAKYAYDYVYDISDYYKVNDSFEFEMTIDELNEYLENR